MVYILQWLELGGNNIKMKKKYDMYIQVHNHLINNILIISRVHDIGIKVSS